MVHRCGELRGNEKAKYTLMLQYFGLSDILFTDICILREMIRFAQLIRIRGYSVNWRRRARFRESVLLQRAGKMQKRQTYLLVLYKLEIIINRTKRIYNPTFVPKKEKSGYNSISEQDLKRIN